MRKSPIGYGLPLLLVGALCLFGLIFYQRVILIAIQVMIHSGSSSGLPVSTTQVSGFSFPTASAPVALGKEAIVDPLGITVTRVIRPADRYLGNAAFPSVPREGKEYLVVDVSVRCLSSAEKCHLTEFDFGLETQAGHDYAAELSGNYSGLKGLFIGGDIEPGMNRSGSMIFVIETGERGLTLTYPRLSALGSSAKLLLGK
jgi:hypothetical protein